MCTVSPEVGGKTACVDVCELWASCLFYLDSSMEQLTIPTAFILHWDANQFEVICRPQRWASKKAQQVKKGSCCISPA